VTRVAIVEVDLRDGSRLRVNVISHDPYADIALLRVERGGLKPIDIGDSDGLQVGQLVFASANPFGANPSTTSGIITTAKASLGWGPTRGGEVIVTDCPLNPGYSGGPLVDASGRMIGLNVAYVNSRGISIPINSVKSTITALVRDGKIKTAHLGISADAINLPKRLANEPKQEKRAYSYWKLKTAVLLRGWG